MVKRLRVVTPDGPGTVLAYREAQDYCLVMYDKGVEYQLSMGNNMKIKFVSDGTDAIRVPTRDVSLESK